MPADVCFEVSFECGRKIGGIYTVIKTKASEMKKIYGDNYICIGSFEPKEAIKNLIPEDVPGHLEEIFTEMKKIGVDCYYGRWGPADNVKLILLDASSFREKAIIKNGRRDKNVNFIKEILWEKFKIDSYRTSFEYNEPVAWAWASGILIEKFLRVFEGKRIVAHFHEWLSGAGLLYLRQRNLPIALVFTTHATKLGRAKAGSGEDITFEIYTGLKSGKKVDPSEAYKYGVEAEHMMEIACAKNADVFTTVSEVIADEAEYILGVKPHIITPNALDFNKFPSMRELGNLHLEYLKKMNRFIEACFSAYYNTNLKNNMIIFTSGRYEFHNKGHDIFIGALKKLNDMMIKEKIDKEVYAFFFVPSSTKRPKVEILDNMVVLEKIYDMVDEEIDDIRERIVEEIAEGRFQFEKILGEDFITDAKAIFKRFRAGKEGKLPPMCPFELTYDEDRDLIIRHLKEAGLRNEEKDKVKVIFYPSYLGPEDELLGLEYEQAVIGSTIGVFPSRYEPWGYTPHECAALMTISVTTDLGGFGRFIFPYTKERKISGIKVLKMKDRSKEDVINELAKFMFNIVKMTKDERVRLKVNARQLAELSNWKDQIVHYIEAHNMALEKLRKRGNES